MSESPIEALLEAIDRFDVDAAMAMIAADGRVLAADGRRAQGDGAVRAMFTNYFSALRSTTHRIADQWHQDNVWIAEVDTSYELNDRTRMGPFSRVFVLREGPDGLADVRVYGAHEHPLTDHRAGEEGKWIGGQWMPPL